MNKKHIIFVTGWAHTEELLLNFAQSFQSEYACHVFTPSKLLELSSRASFNFSEQQQSICADNTDYAIGLGKVISDLDGDIFLIGWSMGGCICLEAATTFYRRISKLVLISSTAKFTVSNDYLFGTYDDNIRAMILQFSRRPEQTLAHFFESVSDKFRNNQSVLEKRVSEAMEINHDVLVHGLHYLIYIDVRSRLPKINFPVLAIHGKKDRVVPYGASEYLKSNLPACSLALFDDVGHNIIEEAKEKIVDTIKEFLNK
jgi:pimeloyl-ACP methyl ester carboxylesterase